MVDDRVNAMAAEMSTLGPCEFHFTPTSMLRAVALLQLAQRHPQLDENHRRFIVTFVEHARGFFASCPTVLAVITEGDRQAEAPLRVHYRTRGSHVHCRVFVRASAEASALAGEMTFRLEEWPTVRALLGDPIDDDADPAGSPGF